MKMGKHSKEAQEIKGLKETINLKDKEIHNIKTECAEQFKKIKDLCFNNEYNGINDSNAKLRKIHDIANDNFNLLLDDIIDIKKYETKIIELPTNRKESK